MLPPFTVLLVGIVALVSLAEAKTPSKTKKTVCTVTINSSDEADAFRSHLSPEQWDFVELTKPEGHTKSDWLRNACAKKVSCDILILSGHFGGTFFGSESDLQLSLEELESASCQSACSGIMDRPKEVFLFGCNTLASKDRDTRTPEEYQRILISDGFSASQASQIAAFRYSAFGDSFRGRMAQVFAQTPRIYGFTALAPSGTTVAPILNRYLSQSSKFYANFEESNNALKSGTNSVLKQAFTYTTLTQVPGLSIAINALKKKPSPRNEIPYCYLANDDETRLSKLRFTKFALQQGRAFTFISHIDKFINEVMSADPLSPVELKVIGEIGRDPKVLKDFDQYLKLPGDVYLPVRVNVLNLMKSLGLLTSAEHGTRILKTLELSFSKPITRAKIDLICSYDVQADIQLNDIPGPRWSEYETFKLLECLRPRNSAIHQRLSEILTTSEDEQIVFNASHVLGQLPVTDASVHRQIADTMLRHEKPEVRRYAVDALSGSKSPTLQIARDIIRVIKTDTDWSVRQAAVYAFRTITTSDPVVLTALVDVMLHDQVWGIRSGAAEALRTLNPTEPSIQSYRKVWEGTTK